MLCERQSGNMRSSIGRLAIWIHEKLPPFRGKQALARITQAALGGATFQTTQDGIQIATRITSSMDLSFLGEGGHSLIRREINLLKEGDTFLDIGANTGYFTLLASRRIGVTGCAIAIEPSIREFELLLRNIAFNRSQNVVALNCAVSNQVALVKLEIERYHTGLNKISDCAESNAGQLVLAYPVESIIPESISKISLVKIDTEGYELFALQGMRDWLKAKAIQKLVIEISPNFLRQHGQHEDQIYCFLEGYGYKPSPSTIRSGKQWDEVFVQA